MRLVGAISHYSLLFELTAKGLSPLFLTNIGQNLHSPEIAPGQARLTLEFFRDRLPEKKLQFVGMSILLILLSPGPGCHTTSTNHGYS